MSRITSTTPTVIAESATLNAQKCALAPVDVDEIDDVAGDDAVDQVAGRAAEDQRQAEARQPLVEAELRRVQRDATSASAAMPIMTAA